jgi:hypothetical protein
MHSEDMIDALLAFGSINRAVYITGQPGSAKTSVVKLAAQKQDRPYWHLHCATRLVEDFSVPLPNHETMQLDYFLTNALPLMDSTSTAVLCLDDFGQSSTDIQKMMANLIQEREFHGHALPDGVHIVATGNRQQDRAGVNRILGHLANRYTELELEVNLDAWCKWAIDNDIHPSIISFVRFRPNLLQDYDPQRGANPTCRSWAAVSDILSVIPPHLEYDCVKGTIGEGASAEFVGFRKIERALPNIDNLLLNPETTDVPTDPATLYAISGAIAHKSTNANFERVIKYANRMPKEFGVLTVSYATRRDVDLASSAAFTSWAVANQDVLF